MWKRSFVATTVAVGGTVDDALAALAGPEGADPRAYASAHARDPSVAVAELVAGLRAPHRAARAAALATAVRDIVLAIDRTTLR